MRSVFHFFFPYHWENTLFKGHPELATILPKKIEEICRTGEGLLLKKKNFHGHIVYTQNIDVHGAHRLIFELVCSNNIHIFCLRSIAFHHDYRKALQWRPLSAQEITTLAADISIDRGIELDINDTAEIGVFRPSQWSTLTTSQRSVLEEKTPLLVSGPPGAGKTLVSMALIQQAALNHLATGNQQMFKIIVITNTKNLKQSFEKEWREWARENELQGNVEVRCFTFNAYIAWCITDLKQKTPVSRAELLTFIDKKLASSSKLTAKIVLLEFSLASYILNQDVAQKNTFENSAYKKLGIRHTHVLEPEQKEEVFKLYLQYKSQLNNSQQDNDLLCDLSEIHSDNLDEIRYDLAVVDEAQKASTQQLLNVLLWMVKHHNVVFCGDTRQGGSQTVSPLSLLPSILHPLTIPLQIKLLTKSHRMPLQVKTLCNDLVLLSDALRDGIPDNTSYSCFEDIQQDQVVAEASSSTETGIDAVNSLYWIPHYKDSYKQFGDDAKAAVIILKSDDYVAATELFAIKSVFTDEEAGGLEFDQVIVFVSKKTLSQFIAINTAMTTKHISSHTPLKTYSHLSANKQSAITSYEPIKLLSQLFTALSRTHIKAYIYFEEHQTLSHQLNVFLAWLILRCTEGDQAIAKKSSEEEWLHTINLFIADGHKQQAITNLQSHCALTIDKAEEYIRFVESGMQSNDSLSYLKHLQQSPCKIADVTAKKDCPPTSLVVSNDVTQAPVIPSKSQKPFKSSSTLLKTSVKKLEIPQCLQQYNNTAKVRDNLEALMSLVLSEPQLKYWLCEHRLTDGLTLFEAIFQDPRSSIMLFLYLTGLKDRKLTNKFFDAIKPFLNTPLSRSVHKNQQATHLQLLITRWSSVAIEQVWDKIKDGINSISLNQEIVLERPGEGRSILFYLLLKPNTHQLVLEQYKNITAEGLCRVFNVDKSAHQGKNPLFLLFNYVPGLSFFIANFNFFKKKISLASLHQPVTGDGEEQGRSAFYWLCATSKGRNLLFNHWMFFFQDITAEQLHRPVTGDGPDQGMSPFYLLCATTEGRNFIFKHWNFFSQHITTEQLHKPVTGKGPDQGSSPFHRLCATPEGRNFLFAHWDFFSQRITAEQLHKPVTGNGPDQGVSPFYLLCDTHEGRSFIFSHWDFFSQRITAEQLHQPVTGDGPDQGSSPFYRLCTTTAGRNFIFSHWEFFSQRITAEQLHQPVTGDGPSQGISPFYWLCASPEGRNFLFNHWEFFSQRITAEQLHQPVTGKGPYQGISPFYLLCATPEGRSFIFNHWEFFPNASQQNNCISR